MKGTGTFRAKTYLWESRRKWPPLMLFSASNPCLPRSGRFSCRPEPATPLAIAPETFPNKFLHPPHPRSSFHLRSLNLTMASEGEPASQYRPESEHSPEAEFDSLDRISLLTTLKHALRENISPTAWACLWLSDIDTLKRRVQLAETDPFSVFSAFQTVESSVQLVPICGL